MLVGVYCVCCLENVQAWHTHKHMKSFNESMYLCLSNPFLLSFTVMHITAEFPNADTLSAS